MKRNGSILGLGYCGLDSLCLVPRIPRDEKVEAERTLVQGGGPAATAVCAAARLGAKTSFIGVVGDDARGQTILDELAREGVDTSNMRVRLEAESAAAFCWTVPDVGERSVVWTHGTAKPLSPEEINDHAVHSVDLLHVDGHHTAAAIRAAEIARAAGVIVSLDAGTELKDLDQLMELADILIASEAFVAGRFGETDAKAALRELRGSGRRFVAVTRGVRGCLGYDGETFIDVPAYKVDVVDTTGAGDVFHGAFAYRRVNGGSWEECARFAAAAAALKCRKFGGRTGIPTLDETEQFLEINT